MMKLSRFSVADPGTLYAPAPASPLDAADNLSIARISPAGNSQPAYVTTQYPWDTICYITDFIDGVEYQGSGVLISPDEVLTASHVLWSTQYGAATDVQVSPGFNAGYAPFGTGAAENFHFNEVQDTNDEITQQQSQYDYAVIHLDQPLTVGYFGLLSDFGGGSVNVTGYPGYLGGEQQNSQQTVSQNPYYSLLDGTSIGKGSSGGPVWVDGSQGPQVVGVVSSEANGTGSTGYFTQITGAAFTQIESWVHEDDGGGSAHAAANDFNGDRTSDILFQNSNSGLLLDWRMSNGGYAQSLPIAGAGSGWQFAGTGDFNGDGTADILFRNANSGLLLYWQMTNGGYGQAVPVAATTPDWQAIGTGDFNGDGTTDILFENGNSHLLLDWQLSDGQYSQAIPIAGAAPGWQFLGTGDFNGDGTTDILFQNTSSGLLLDWQMSGGRYSQAIPIAAVSAGWHFLGTGDFNGDGTTDILFQNSNSGLLLDWQMSGGRFAASIPIAGTTPDWHFVDTGDYNGDGTSDILFRNANSGQLLDWQMSGGHYSQAISIAGTTSDWKTVA